ncbi:MAG TPA: DUF2764 family protein [Bacteroidaceae bacterium]|nr:DUF2764 family protein [Bacteroidaceae bacterium]
MSNYHYLVAGLADITIDDDKIIYSFEKFKEEVYLAVTAKDRKLIDLVYQKYDQDNLLYLLLNLDKPRTSSEDLLTDQNRSQNRALFTIDELTDMISTIRSGDEPSLKYPTYMVEYVGEFFNGDFEIDTPFAKNRLLTLFYRYTQTINNLFVKRWFEFNQDINNIITGYIARNHLLDINSMIVGDNYVAKSISHSSARDWGLSLEIDFFDELSSIQEEKDLILREKKTDILRWRWLDDNSFFNYFSIERLFSFITKIEIVERWISLEKDTGRQLFRSLIESLKQESKIPAEYR